MSLINVIATYVIMIYLLLSRLMNSEPQKINLVLKEVVGCQNTDFENPSTVVMHLYIKSV